MRARRAAIQQRADRIAAGVVALMPARWRDPAAEKQSAGSIECEGLSAGLGAEAIGDRAGVIWNDRHVRQSAKAVERIAAAGLDEQHERADSTWIFSEQLQQFGN